jgi:DNA polymerase-3 subunit alpha
MEQHDAEVLWGQMAEFAKYSFNRAHAFAYALLGYWCAWLKFHYPVEFLTSALSTVDKSKIPDFIKESRRMGLKVLPPDINESGKGFKASTLSVRYGLDSIKGIGDAAVAAITQGQPYESFDDFMERKGPGADAGVVRLLARIGAFDRMVPNRRGLEQRLLAEKTGESTQCIFKDTGFTNKYDLPCHFDWESEPQPINERTGKKLKKKPPPKKCTKACRNYTAPQPMRISDVEAYTDADIRDIEMEMLGVYLSSTPFDRLDSDERAKCLHDAKQQAQGGMPEGTRFLLAVTVSAVRPYVSRNNQKMGFVTLETEVSEVEAVVFSTPWIKFGKSIKKGALAMASIYKTDRGWALDDYAEFP